MHVGITFWSSIQVSILLIDHVTAPFVIGAPIRVPFNASSPWFPYFFIFSLADGFVVSLPIWFLNSEHGTWRRGALSLQLS